jgi:beta-mannosidase
MQTIDLSGTWRLLRASTGEMIPAMVPGETHSALFSAGKIPHPYRGRNELDVQWVGQEDWIYERDVTVDASFLSEEIVCLSCDCLDTIASITLNGTPIGSADNMFVRWRFDAKRALRVGKNTLRIRFTSAEKTAQAAARKLAYPVPHTKNPVQSPHRNLVRKIQCHGGWDWGPCLMVAGIGGRIELQAFSDARIDYVATAQKHGKGKCMVRVSVDCEAARDGAAELVVALGDETARRTVTLVRGINSVLLDVTVGAPRLWWPNGYGEAFLYDLTVTLGGHSVRKRLGLRRLSVVNRKDRAGVSMTFRVNGVDVFCKGANWIPSDAMPGLETRESLAHLLGSAAWANMNMLRVWGGGRYESDDFYDLCDEKGIMVWQDMMFSCSLYPATPGFLASVEKEIRHQVRRLRDHPCIALWCGNNENIGALTWFPESRANRDRYLVDYDRLNEGVVGRTVDECDPTRIFWPSSPSAGRGDYSDNWHDDSRGDMHFWSVWHEGKPFSAYHDVMPRFCTEFGYQSFPSLATILTYAEAEDLNVTSPVMEHHQRSPRGNSNITEMFTRYFRMPESFESFVYLSQVQQAMAIASAVEYWRGLRPLCMGTLYWQLNDTWPVCSWSSIEYGGTWKLLHYAARRFFAPVLLAAYLKDGRLHVRLTNDLREDVRCSAAVSLIDFSGTVLATEDFDLRVPAGSSRLVKEYPRGAFAPSPEAGFVHLTLERAGETSFGSLFLTEPKRCPIQRASVHTEVIEKKNGFSLRVSTDAPAFYVALGIRDIPGNFDDNCFTLLPGAPRKLQFIPTGKATLDGVRRNLTVTHLRDTWQ